MSAIYSLSAEGVKHLDRWETAVQRLARLKSEIRSAECELTNAENALGKFIVPEPADLEEKFNIWIGNGLLAAEKTGANDYKVSWRKPQTGSQS